MVNSIVEHIKNFVKREILLLILMGVVGFLIYFPVIKADFIADDGGQIVNNIYIKDVKNIPLFFKGGTFYVGGTPKRLEGSYYRPVMLVFYSVLYNLSGGTSVGFHIFQISIHVLNAFLLFLLLKHFLLNAGVAALLAVVFLVHPMNVEAVAYIADLQDVLFFFFGMLAFYAMIKAGLRLYSLILISLLLFISLLSKEIAIAFMAVMFAYLDLYKVKGKTYYVIAVSCIVAVYAILRCYVADICMLQSNAPISSLPLVERLKHIPAVLWYYLSTFFFPKDLAIFQYWLVDKITAQNFYLPLIFSSLFFLFLLSIPFVVYARRNSMDQEFIKTWLLSKKPLAKAYALFVCWFFVGIFLHVHIISLDFTVADRWFYFPMAGLLGIVGVLIVLVSDEVKRVIKLFLLGAIIILSIRAHYRNLDWQNAYKLYSNDIKISKNSAPLENNLGFELAQRNKTSEALVHFKNAVALRPTSPLYLSNLAATHEQLGNYKDAERVYLESIKQGRFIAAFEGYTKLLIKQNRKNEAKKFLKDKALKTFPHNQPLKDLYKKLNNS